MSAETTTAPSATTATGTTTTTGDATTTATNNGANGGAAKGKRNNNNNNNNRRENNNVNVEELYDLTKPLPKVEKPEEKEYQTKIDELNEMIESLKISRTELQEKIETSMAESEAKNGIQQARVQLNELKNAKNKLIEEKKLLRKQLDEMKSQTDQLLNDKKNTKSNVKFHTIEEIDKEIASLQKKQETTSMKLNDEKRLIKEIDTLKASKKFIVELKNTDASIDDVKEQRKNLTNLITAKDKEIDEYSKQIKTVMETMDQLNSDDKVKKEVKGGLLKERDELRNQMTDKIKERDALRDELRAKNDAWYTYQRALKKQKQLQYEEEKRKREEEKAAYLAKLEEEEAKKIPYEEEQALCDFLANYLERTYLNKKDNDNDDEALPTNLKADSIVQVSDDPFAGLKPVSKKNEDDIDYFGKGKGKKKRVRQGKKQDEVINHKFTLSVDTFEQFGLIQLTPPTSLEQVASSVQQLREKKEWYKVQPRGSVPTAKEIIKQQQRQQQQQSNHSNNPSNNNNRNSQMNNGGRGAGGAGGNKNKSFELSSDDFAPLVSTNNAASSNAGTSSSLGSSGWGQQKWGTSTANSVSDAAPTPAEAAAAAAAAAAPGEGSTVEVADEN